MTFETFDQSDEELTNILTIFHNLEFFTILIVLKIWIFWQNLTTFESFKNLGQFWQYFLQCWQFLHKDNLGQFWQFLTILTMSTILDNFDNICYLTIKSDPGHHSQFDVFFIYPISFSPLIWFFPHFAGWGHYQPKVREAVLYIFSLLSASGSASASA